MADYHEPPFPFVRVIIAIMAVILIGLMVAGHILRELKWG